MSANETDLDTFRRVAGEMGVDVPASEPETPAVEATPPADPPVPAETQQTETPAVPSETPAETPPVDPAAAAVAAAKRKYVLKLDHSQEEVEADDEEVARALQVHRKIDDIRAREALKGAHYVVDALRSQGVDAELWLNPETRLYEARVRKPVTTPTPAEPAAPPASNTIDVAELERLASEGDAEAHLKLLKLEREERKRLAEQFEKEKREAQEALERTSFEAQANRIQSQVAELRKQHARVFEGPRGQRAWDIAIGAAKAAARDGAPEAQVIAIIKSAALDREQEMAEWVKQAIPATPKAPAPPPVVGGGAPVAQRQAPALPWGPDDPEFEKKMAALMSG